MPSSFQESIDSVSFRYSIQGKDGGSSKNLDGQINKNGLKASFEYPLIVKHDESGD